MNPRLLMNILQSLHVQPSGIQFLTRVLNWAKDVESLMTRRVVATFFAI